MWGAALFQHLRLREGRGQTGCKLGASVNETCREVRPQPDLSQGQTDEQKRWEEKKNQTVFFDM